MRADQIREKLQHEHGYTEEQVAAIKGITALREELESLNMEEEYVFEETESESESVASEERDSSIPSYYSPEWNEYVMSLLTESELTEGYPTVNGLRRVSELLLGNIVDSGPIREQVFHEGLDGYGRATCVFEIVFDWKIDAEGYPDQSLITQKRFRAFGGAMSLNISDKLYKRFPEALSETRAEVRALRRALKLTNPAYEELSDSRTAEDVLNEVSEFRKEGEDSTKTQHAFIKQKCDQLGIAVEEVLNGKELIELTHTEAVNVIKDLNKKQQPEV